MESGKEDSRSKRRREDEHSRHRHREPRGLDERLGGHRESRYRDERLGGHRHREPRDSDNDRYGCHDQDPGHWDREYNRYDYDHDHDHYGYRDRHRRYRSRVPHHRHHGDDLDSGGAEGDGNRDIGRVTERERKRGRNQERRLPGDEGEADSRCNVSMTGDMVSGPKSSVVFDPPTTASIACHEVLDPASTFEAGNHDIDRVTEHERMRGRNQKQRLPGDEGEVDNRSNISVTGDMASGPKSSVVFDPPTTASITCHPPSAPVSLPVAAESPSECLVLNVSFDRIDKEKSEPKYIKYYFLQKCAGAGDCNHIHVDKQNSVVYLRFRTARIATLAHAIFHGKFYEGNLITANFMHRWRYYRMFPIND